METAKEIDTSRFDSLMAMQQELCDLYRKRLSGESGVQEVHLNEARFKYMAQLRSNTRAIVERNTNVADATFQDVSLFLTERMTEIIDSIAGFTDDQTIHAEDIARCCQSDYEKLVAASSDQPLDTTTALEVVVNDAADTAVPVAIQKAQSYVKQSQAA